MSVKFISHFNKVKKEIDKAKEMKVKEATIHVRNATVKKLTGNRTGRTYKVPGTNKFYTASSPGQPPASALGDLRQSIKTDIDKQTGLVGSELKKAPMLEFGTRNMAARPFLRPTFVEETDEVGKILGKKWF